VVTRFKLLNKLQITMYELQINTKLFHQWHLVVTDGSYNLLIENWKYLTSSKGIYSIYFYGFCLKLYTGSLVITQCCLMLMLTEHDYIPWSMHDHWLFSEKQQSLIEGSQCPIWNQTQLYLGKGFEHTSHMVSTRCNFRMKR